MKDAMMPPHILHMDEIPINFNGKLRGLKVPSFVNREFTNYPIIFEKRANTVRETKRFFIPEPFIPLCKLAGSFLNARPRWGTNPDTLLYKASFCTLFRPTFTDQGICYAFNAKQPYKFIKESNYLNSFHKVFGRGHSFGQNFEPFNITGMGASNGLTLYLDAHTLTGQYKSGKSENRVFQFNFDHFDSFPLVSFGGIQVRTGQKTTIVLTPRVLTSTPEVQTLSLKDRSCQFKDEPAKSVIFSEYSHSGCLFECLLEQARCHFYQHFNRDYFVRMYITQLFSSYSLAL